jgi:hypothetical protein
MNLRVSGLIYPHPHYVEINRGILLYLPAEQPTMLALLDKLDELLELIAGLDDAVPDEMLAALVDDLRAMAITFAAAGKPARN